MTYTHLRFIDQIARGDSVATPKTGKRFGIWCDPNYLPSLVSGKAILSGEYMNDDEGALMPYDLTIADYDYGAPVFMPLSLDYLASGGKAASIDTQRQIVQRIPLAVIAYQNGLTSDISKLLVGTPYASKPGLFGISTGLRDNDTVELFVPRFGQVLTFNRAMFNQINAAVDPLIASGEPIGAPVYITQYQSAGPEVAAADDAYLYFNLGTPTASGTDVAVSILFGVCIGYNYVPRVDEPQFFIRCALEPLVVLEQEQE